MSDFTEGPGYHSPIIFSPPDFTAGQSYYSPIISADDMQIEEDRKLITSQTIKIEKKNIYNFLFNFFSLSNLVT